MLTNDIVSFEQLGPECFLWIPVVLYEEVIIVYMVYGLPDLVPSVWSEEGPVLPDVVPPVLRVQSNWSPVLSLV